MKMNKLAAGALALALGLGAVAPAVASEHGTKVVEYAYNLKMTEAQKLLDKKLAADKKAEEAKARYEAAKKALKAAKDKYNDLKDDEDYKVLDQKTEEENVNKIRNKISELVKDQEEAAKELTEDRVAAETKFELSKKKKAYEDLDATERAKSDNPTVKAYFDALKDVEKAVKDAKEARVNAAKAAVDAKTAEYKKALDRLAKATEQANNPLKALERYQLAPKAKAYLDLQDAKKEEAEAEVKLGVALADQEVTRAAFENAYTKLGELANGIRSVVAIEGTKIVVKETKEAGKKSVAEAVKALKASIDDNKAAVKSAEFLLQNAPKSVAKVKAKLEAQIVKAKAAITKGEAALAKVEKKMAFIATAYAAEDDVKVEDLEALTKENKESASDINNTIKENEKEQPAVEEEKKPEEKKPEENKPARKAGKNAKTGIAGIAGVAGILAAASVAYAASKRD